MGQKPTKPGKAKNGLIKSGDFSGLTSPSTWRCSRVWRLTMGGWFLFNAIGVDAGLISKFGAAGQRSYMLEQRSSDTVQLRISVDGTALVDVTSGTITTAQWYFIAGRFTPSTEQVIWLNEEKTINTTSIPASIFNSTTAFQIGAFNSGSLVNGRASLCFLSANALSDGIVSSLFQQTRGVFGV